MYLWHFDETTYVEKLNFTAEPKKKHIQWGTESHGYLNFPSDGLCLRIGVFEKV